MKARRILVALDGSAESLAALAAAARLGVSTGAELSGLFIEDVELLRLARLPFAVEVGLAAPERRPLEPANVERRYRLAAERAREALHAAARASALRSTFRVARGRVVPELLAASGEADVVAVGKRSAHTRAGRRLGRTTRDLLAHVRTPVLVGGVPGVSAERAVVACGPHEPEEVERLGALLARAFGAPRTVVVSWRPLSSRYTKASAEIAGASIVVLFRPEAPAGHDRVIALAEAVTCPVLVVGPEGLAELLSASRAGPQRHS